MSSARRISILVCGLSLAATAAAAQNDSARADAAFRAADWRSVADLYARITSQSPNQGLAWFRLGLARHTLRDIDGAIAAFQQALKLQFQQPGATFRLARLNALKGDADLALDYFEALVPMRAIPVPMIDTTSDFASIRSHPRFRAAVDRMTALRFPCRGLPESHQLDFWIGDWIVTPWAAPAGPTAQLLGNNRIEPILEHCVLMENWTNAGGGSGKSMNFWDTNRGQWRQIWMADGGGSLDYAGSFRDGAMRFEGWTLAPNGARILQKLTFFPIHRDTVRQLFETSSDSGKSWQPGFDGRYTRRKP
jgi:hypothetical protein